MNPLFTVWPQLPVQIEKPIIFLEVFLVLEAALVSEGVLDYPTYSQSVTELRQTHVSETTALGLTLYGVESRHNNCPFLGSIIYILPFQVTASPFGEGI